MPLRPEQEYSEYKDRYVNWNGLLEELKACINAVGGGNVVNSTQYEDSWRGVQLALSQLRSQLLTFNSQVSTNVGAAQSLLSQKGQPNGLASLDAGAKLPLNQLPALPTPTAAQVGAISIGEKAAANGVATLNASGIVPAAQLPAFEAPGAATSAIASHVAATDPHAQYATDADLTTHTGNTSNPHSTTAAQVGAIASSLQGAANGVATLGGDGILTAAQRPSITPASIGAIANTEKAAANGVATLNASGIVPATQLPSFPSSFVHFHDESIMVAGGGLTLATSTSQYFNIYSFQAGALNDEFQFYKSLAAGNYTLFLLGLKFSAYGIATVRVNGAVAGTLDLYNSTILFNVIVSIPFSIAFSGNHLFNFKIESKNASSTGYTFPATKFWAR
jgi:hypothetical protein